MRIEGRRMFWKPASGALLLGLALSGCATMTSPQTSGPEEPVSISYETGPCFGACPVYRVTVTARGEGRFEGRRFTAVEGERSFTLTRSQYDMFARHLTPFRPRAGSVRYAGEACERMATDMPSVDVEWKGADGSGQSLHFYFGCDMEKNRALAERLRAAPDLLPIGAFIKPAAKAGT